MAEQHYDEDALLAFLPSVDAAATDPHLTACTECRDKLASFRMVAEVLAEEATWDRRPLNEAPNPQTIATLRAFAEQMAAQDAEAEPHVAALLEGPRETWPTTLEAHPEWRTAGMVRRLIEAVPSALDTMPPDAVAMTALATNIADSLESSADLDRDTVSRLRGAAYREHAYALFYTGAFPDAEQALLASERHFSDCAVDEYDLARVGIVRALVERAMERYGASIMAARSSIATFHNSEDFERLVSAVITHAQTLSKVNRTREALGILLQTQRECGMQVSSDTQARLLANIGHCYQPLGDPQRAIEAYRCAAFLFTQLGVVSESARLRVNVAVVMRESGRMKDAVREFTSVLQEFEALGLASEVAGTAVVLSELLLLDRRFAEVQTLCQRAIRYLEAAGVPYGEKARTALAYIHEAAAAQKATPEHARQIHRYIRRLPNNPSLLFAPPPY